MENRTRIASDPTPRRCHYRHCMEDFVPAHGNQLYCNNNHKIYENTLKAKDRKALLLSSFGPIEENFRLLSQLLDWGLDEIFWEQLQSMGFDITLHSRISKEDGHTVYWFRNVGLKRIGPNTCKILRNDLS